MSLCSTYVRTDKGRWAKDPIVEGIDWFMCFDDDDPIEIVIEDKPDAMTIDSIVKLLGARGFIVCNPRKTSNYQAQRVFGEDWDFRPARAYFVDYIDSELPEDMIQLPCDFLTRRPREGVFYGRLP